MLFCSRSNSSCCYCRNGAILVVVVFVVAAVL